MRKTENLHASRRSGRLGMRVEGSEPHGHVDASTVTGRGLRQTFGGAGKYALRRLGGRARIEKVVTNRCEA